MDQPPNPPKPSTPQTSSFVKSPSPRPTQQWSPPQDLSPSHYSRPHRPHLRRTSSSSAWASSACPSPKHYVSIFFVYPPHPHISTADHYPPISHPILQASAAGKSPVSHLPLRAPPPQINTKSPPFILSRTLQSRPSSQIASPMQHTSCPLSHPTRLATLYCAITPRYSPQAALPGL